MRPYIICHMLSSIDGRIDGAALEAVTTGGEYEATGALLKGDAWICGRTTMQLHFAEKRSFTSRAGKAAGTEQVFVARRANSYAIAVDTLGRLRWASDEIGGDHLICVVSERAKEAYLAMLRKQGISYIACGKRAVDLKKAVALLRTRFGIRRLLLEGGGTINGAFLEAGLIDELSLLVVPGVDGRRDVPTVFDQMEANRKKASPLKLVSVKKRKGGTLWIRYKMK